MHRLNPTETSKRTSSMLGSDSEVTMQEKHKALLISRQEKEPSKQWCAKLLGNSTEVKSGCSLDRGASHGMQARPRLGHADAIREIESPTGRIPT